VPEEASGFSAIAPYLQHPLVLAGFALFLVFGLLCAFLGSDKLQQVRRPGSGRLLATVLRYGFVLACIVLILGFGLVFYREFGAEQARVERDQAVAVAARDAEERLVGGLFAELGEQGAHPAIVAAVVRAVGAVAAQARQPETAPEAGSALADLAQGDSAAAEALLRASAERKEAEWAAALAEAAQAWRDPGALAFLDDTAKAREAYRRAAALQPDDVWTWILVGRLERQDGNLAAAADAFTRARELAAAGGAERDLGVSHNRIGDVRVVQGGLTGARVHYEAGLAIRERLAKADPHNTDRQRDLAVSHSKIGDVRRAQGDLAGALEAYEAGHAIAEHLAAADPRNAVWQRDLSLSHERIGDVRVAEGDLAGARVHYEAGLAIHERLAAADPRNAEWQRDLIVSNVKLAELAASAGERDAAHRRYTAALAIARNLAATGRLAPADAWMPAELERRLAALKGSRTE
jgi:tetratricopeptide (TPR) repeat protein